MGVWNEGSMPLSGEVWMNELRLGQAVRDAGLAGSFEAELDGAGVITTRFTMTDRGALFRQLRGDPTYQTDRTLTLASTLRLERWAPAEWGIELPLTLNLDRVDQAPRFLANSDVRVDRLESLRATEAHQTRVGLAFRKSTRSPNPWVGFLLDGLDARVAYSRAGGSTVTAQRESNGLDAGLNWAREPEYRDVPLVPGIFRDAVRWLLPGFLEEPIVDARVRWTPERVSLGTSYMRQDARIFRFDGILELPGDSLATATLAPREIVEAAADVRFRPLQSLSANLTFLTLRDLLPPEDAVSDPRLRDLIRRERSSVAGMDLGWETNRNLRTRLSFRPQLFTWLRHDFDWTTFFQTDRNANFTVDRPLGADTLLALARNASGQRDWRAVIGLDPRALAVATLGPDDPDESPDIRQLRTGIEAFRPVSVTYQDGVTSRFNRDPVSPGLEYQLGWTDIDGFRFLDADTAATLTDRAAWTVSSGMNLPGGLGMDVRFFTSRGTTLDTRSDREIVQRTWPDVRASLPPLNLGSVLGLQRVTLSSGFRKHTRETVYGGRGTQTRFQEDTQVPVDVTLTWMGSLVTSYRGSIRQGKGTDPTGDTEHDEVTHRVAVSAQLAPPGKLARRLDRPVRLSLILGYAAESDCRSTAAAEECVPFVDQLRRSMSLSLDTAINGFGLGLQMSYDRRQSFVGQRTGSTQFQLGLFGQLQFSAGTFGARPLR